MPIRTLIWNEFRHERQNPAVAAHYPVGIHETIREFLDADPAIQATTATLDEDEHGLPEDRLASTDVLVWWGHRAHDEVRDEVAARVQQHVLSGMGFIALHSAHYAKPFKLLMGTSCSLKWREAGEKERVWNLAPNHLITQGLDEFFELPQTEMYGEPFAIPEPEQLVFVSWFPGGEVFRSGCTWRRGHGKVFYFRPGHETYPIYHHTTVQTVIRNAVLWAASPQRIPDACPNVDPLEPLPHRA